MALAIGGTLLYHGIIDYRWVLIALVVGSIVGIPLGLVHMTAVPQRTALSHAFGALCVTLVGTAEFYLRTPDVPRFMMAVLSMEVILGSLTFTGSLMAAGKLQEDPAAAAHHLQGPEHRQPLAAGDRDRHRGLSGAASRTRRAVPADDCDPARVRRHDDRAHRRRGHAHGHLAPQLLRRPFRRGHGIRAQQQAA